MKRLSLLGMYQVRVYKTIWNKTKQEVDDILYNQSSKNDELKSSSYFYDVTLEFPPYVNLELFSERWTCGEIKRVSWNIDEKRFYCYTEDEYPSRNASITCYPVLDYDEDFLKDKCLRNGWKILTSTA